MASSQSIDCSNYDSEKCKKGNRLHFPRNKLHDMIILACWGVYCQSGPRIRYKKKKGKDIEGSQVELGQTYVFNGIYEDVKRGDISDIFFAGDNVYRYGYPLENIENKEEKLGFEMDKQLKSFESCYAKIKPHVSRTFIAIGNHDIETCDILNQQLNYNGWEQTGVYYSVCYNDEDETQRGVTIIVLDTNMYEKKPYQCDQETKFSEEDIRKQEEFIIEECKHAQNDEDWLIIIGHIPAIATGHKSSNIENESLLKLIKKCQPHLYVCGDEHNQQFIYRDLISFAIVGSGGTDLDTLNEEKMSGTRYAKKNFGFLRLSFDNHEMNITFKVSYDDEKTENTCKIPIRYDRSINEASIICG